MRDKRNSHDESAEEDVEMGTKDDKRPADDTTTQNDPSPPKRSWSASEEVSTPPTGKGTEVSKDVAMTVTITCKRAGSTRQSSRSRRDSSETCWKKKQLRRSRGFGKYKGTVQEGQEVLIFPFRRATEMLSAQCTADGEVEMANENLNDEYGGQLNLTDAEVEIKREQQLVGTFDIGEEVVRVVVPKGARMDRKVASQKEGRRSLRSRGLERGCFLRHIRLGLRMSAPHDCTPSESHSSDRRLHRGVHAHANWGSSKSCLLRQLCVAQRPLWSCLCTWMTHSASEK